MRNWGFTTREVPLVVLLITVIAAYEELSSNHVAVIVIICLTCVIGYLRDIYAELRSIREAGLRIRIETVQKEKEEDSSEENAVK